ncbi:MAG TPA: SHOCT domain-containing protein [Candidatus Limnocylindrales bacterium]
MFRRRAVFVRRPFLRRPRLLGAALIGGLGFAAGRASRRPPEPAPPPQTSPADSDVAAKLKELTELHASGALSDEEFSAAKGRLLG